MAPKPLTKEQFIERAERLHGEGRYDYSKTEYVNNSTKVEIVCHQHEIPIIFKQRPCDHIYKNGCPECAKNKCGKYAMYSKEVFIEKANTIHNNKYDYSVCNYTASTDMVDIICKEHGVFNIRASAHIDGQGCRECGFYTAKEKLKTPWEDFIKKVRENYGDKYVYCEKEYEGIAKNIKIECKLHGYFTVKAYNHFKGVGACPKCKKNYRNTSIFIEKAKEIHGELYDYSKTVYTKAINNVDIMCKEHGTFTQQAYVHLKGHGCQVCAKSGFDSSKPTSLYLTRWYGFGEEFLKFGITNRNVTDRTKQQYNKGDLDFNILYCFNFDTGKNARKIELHLLRNLECGVCPKQWLPDGYTETTHVENLPKILDYIKTNYGLDPEDYKYKE